jgi:hypothetical protein
MVRRYNWSRKLAIINLRLSNRQKLIKSYFIIIFLVVVPLLLLLLPENYFDTGETICLSQRLFNQECYACGLTRACQHLIHLNFEEAYRYNMLSFLAFPSVSILWATWFFKEFKNNRIFSKKLL